MRRVHAVRAHAPASPPPSQWWISSEDGFTFRPDFKETNRSELRLMTRANIKKILGYMDSYPRFQVSVRLPITKFACAHSHPAVRPPAPPPPRPPCSGMRGPTLSS